jgi:PEP-CTERM motif
MANFGRHARVVAIAAVLLPFGAAPAAAAVCNLTVAGSTCSDVSFGGAIYTNVLPVGTFYIDPFLQIKSSSTVEQGYNTGGDYIAGGKTDYQYQQAGDTSNLLLSDVPIVTINGVEYREFLLAINEPGSNPLLSLDQLQIFLSPTQNVMNYDPSTGKLGGLTAVYDMDAGTASNWVKLNYSVPEYNGPGTAIVYIPNSLFTTSTNPQYVYLYSQFGATAGAGAGGGLEEWWVKTNGTGTAVTRTVTPEPGSLLLLGTGVALVAARLRKRRR